MANFFAVVILNALFYSAVGYAVYSTFYKRDGCIHQFCTQFNKMLWSPRPSLKHKAIRVGVLYLGVLLLAVGWYSVLDALNAHEMWFIWQALGSIFLAVFLLATILDVPEK